MKIVHIEDFFHPEAGYQVNILAKYMQNKGHNITILTGELNKTPEYLLEFFGKDDIEKKDMLYTQETGVEIIRVPVKKHISGRVIYDIQLNKIVKRLKPDVVFVHGNDTAIGIKFMMNLGKTPYAIVTDSHMLEMASANHFRKLFRKYYELLITPKIKKYKLPIIRTQNDNYVQKCLGIPIEQCPYIPLGADMMLFYPSTENKIKFRKQNNICEEDFVVVYAGKLDESKGGKLLAETFLESFSRCREVVLIVVGNTAGDYGKEVELMFNKSANKIIRFSTQPYIKLAQFYQMADLAVFPKQCSLSFYDVQACGIPVVSENNEINTDRMSHNNGFTFERNSVLDFRAKILKCVQLSREEYKTIANNSYYYIKNNFDYDIICEQYLEIIENEYLRQIKMERK